MFREGEIFRFSAFSTCSKKKSAVLRVNDFVIQKSTKQPARRCLFFTTCFHSLCDSALVHFYWTFRLWLHNPSLRCRPLFPSYLIYEEILSIRPSVHQNRTVTTNFPRFRLGTSTCRDFLHIALSLYQSLVFFLPLTYMPIRFLE